MSARWIMGQTAGKPCGGCWTGDIRRELLRSLLGLILCDSRSQRRIHVLLSNITNASQL